MHLLQAGGKLDLIFGIYSGMYLYKLQKYTLGLIPNRKRGFLKLLIADIIPVMDKVEGSWEKDSKLKHWLKGLGK